MKTKRVFLSLLVMLYALTGSAYSFMVDSICYKILSNTDNEKTVAVTANDGRYNSFRYSGDIIIPSTVSFGGNTYNVTEIAWYAFYQCYDLTSVSIPNSVNSIGGYAFLGCSKLTSITLPNSIDKIERSTFYGSGLTSIQIPENVESIGDYAFYGCGSLRTISLGNVTSIGEHAFSSSTSYSSGNLNIVDIPSSVISIGDYAFYNRSIQTLTLHEGLKKIGQDAFRNCDNLTSVSIPSSVENIGTCAFYNCSSLSTINISTFAPKYMGGAIFTGTSWLNSQPDGVIYLGKALFQYKGTMPENTTFSVPVGTTCIAGSAFSSKTGLKSITIPSSVEGIGPSAFVNCTALETIDIPDGINNVGSRAFYNTAWYNNHPDGLIYIGNVLYRYKGDMAENTAVELRNGTTAIVDTAFYNCTNLTSVTIPNSVKDIGKQVFSGCSSLSDVTLPGISLINEKTFENCTNLQSLSLPEGVNVIGGYAFAGCTSLTNIVWPSTISEIKDYAFSHCSSLSSMALPEGLCYFGSYIFEYCTSLTSITFPSTLGGGFEGGSTSRGNPNIQEVRFLSSKAVPRAISNVIGGLGTESFDIYKFIYYVPHGMREEYEPQISWNDRILEMGEDEDVVQFADPEVQRICIANYDANNSGTVDKVELGEVHYPMIASMFYFYKQEFVDNTTITSFNEFRYFTNCTEIPNYFISGCSNLTSITLPITVTAIQDNAFSGCSSLEKLIVLNPNPAVSIEYANGTPRPGENPFANQQNCKLYVPEGSKVAYQEAEYWKDFPVIIEVIDGASQEFQDLVELSGTLQIELNHAVEGTKKGQYPIGSKAEFQSVIDDVNSMINKNISQAEITLLTERLITAKNDFENKVYLIGIGDSFLFQPEGSSSTLGFYIVSRDPNIVRVTPRKYYDGNEWTSYYSGDIVIPETVIWDGVGYSVKGIESEAFMYSTITSISIPNSVTSIGNWAFYNCSGLTKAEFSSIESLCNINFGMERSNPLSYAHHLYINGEEVKDLVIPNGVTSIGNSAFSSCSGLTSVTIPNSVTSIGNNAFSYCRGLTSVTIPNGVTSIGNYAFDYCSGLTSVTIPKSVTSIGSDAFFHCSGLTSIQVENGNSTYDSRNDCNAIIETGTNTLLYGCQNTVIPNGVTSIGNYAFYYCSGLTSVTIPNSVTSIDNNAFYYCSGLTSVVSEIETPFAFGSSAFVNLSPSCTLTVPSGKREAYINAGWTTSVFRGGIIDLSDPGTIYLATGDFFKAKTIEGLDMSFKVMDNTQNIVQVANRTSYSSAIDNNVTGTVTIPNKVVYGGKEYTITSIGNYAFYSCSGLTSVTIPNSVTSIDNNAFYYCSGLTSVVSKIEEPFAFGSNAFRYIASTCTLTVPAGTRDAYIAAGWTEDVFKGGVVEAEPTSVIAGDANGDGEVDVFDVTEMVNYILGSPSEGFVVAAADLNGDGEVDVFDVTKAVNIILGVDVAGANMRRAVPVDETGTMLLTTNSLGTNLVVDDAERYVAMQFDVVVPTGETVKDVTLNSRTGHAFTYEQMEANRYRVIAYSMRNASFKPTEDALVSLTQARGASIENAVFVTTDGHCIHMTVTGEATGIEEMTNGNSQMGAADGWYTLDGHKLSGKPVEKGVYIRNNKKYIIK